MTLKHIFIELQNQIDCTSYWYALWGMFSASILFTCTSVLLCVPLERNLSSRHLATVTLVVKNSTVYLCEIERMRAFFLITANRIRTFQVTLVYCDCVKCQCALIKYICSIICHLKSVTLFRNSHFMYQSYLSVLLMWNKNMKCNQILV